MFELQREAKPIFDLNRQNLALAQIGNRLEHLDCLVFKKEVPQGGFRARSVVGAHFHLLHDARGGVEHRLAISDMQPLDATEVESLEKFDEPGLRVGQNRFGNWLVHAGTPILKSRSCPTPVTGGNFYDSPFPALSTQRWGNAFKKEALLPA
jgi:hypothetical protein